MTEWYIHAAQVEFSGAAQNAEDMLLHDVAQAMTRQPKDRVEPHQLNDGKTAPAGCENDNDHDIDADGSDEDEPPPLLRNLR